MIKKILTTIAVLLPFISYSQLNTKISVGGALYTGNVDKSDFRVAGEAAYKDSTYELSTFLKLEYGEVEKTANREEYSGGIKFDYKPSAKVTPFAMITAYKNKYKGYDLRLSGYLGAKYTIPTKNKENSYSISSAVIYDNERYPEIEGIEKSNKNLIRLSIFPQIKQKLGKSIFLAHQTLFKYTILSEPEDKVKVEGNDWIIDSKTSLTNKLSEKIYLELIYEINYVGRTPNKAIKNTDQAFYVSLVIKL